MKILDLTQPDLDALVEERDRLKAALEGVEWVESGDEDEGFYHCPRCRRGKPNHHLSCDVRLALGREP